MIPTIRKKEDKVIIKINGMTFDIPFPALVKGLLEAGFDIAIPKRDPDADKLYSVEFSRLGEKVEVKVSAKDTKEAIANAIKNGDGNGVTFDTVRAVFVGYPPSEAVADITAKVITEWQETLDENQYVLSPESKPDKTPDLEPEVTPEHVSTQVKEMADPFAAIPKPEPEIQVPPPAPIQAPVVPLQELGGHLDKKERIAACKEQGEECQFCKKKPDDCDGKYQSPF